MTDRGAAIEERVRRLEDIEAARGLLADYARACDAQDLDRLVALFAAEGAVEAAGRDWPGAAGVRAFFQEAWAADPSAKSHFVTNVRVVSSSQGSVALDAYFLYTAAGDASSVLGWGEYRDVVDTSGPRPLFLRKAMSLTRSADVRDGWAAPREGAG